MTIELDISLLSETAETAHLETMLTFKELFDDLGTEAMFQVASETTLYALVVEGNLRGYKRAIDSGERLSTELWESMALYLLKNLARLCAGEYFLHSSSPDIMKLSQDTILLWPSQPLVNFSYSVPVLEGAYWFVHGIRDCCTSEISHLGQFIECGRDVPRQLAAGFNKLLDKIPDIKLDHNLNSEENYNPSECAIARLANLYRATKQGCNMDDISKYNNFQPHLKPTEERIVNYVKEAEQPLRAEDIAKGIPLNNNSHFRDSLSSLVRIEVLARAPMGGYELGRRALNSGQKSGSKSGESQK